MGELEDGGFQVFGDFGGDQVRIGQVGRVLQALVFQPEDIQVDFVALEKVFE